MHWIAEEGESLGMGGAKGQDQRLSVGIEQALISREQPVI
jgi:hypothetical protein